MKLSYSFLPSVGTALLGLVNRKTTEYVEKLTPKQVRPDCINKENQACPVGRKCNLLDKVYRAEIVHNNAEKTENYVGMCSVPFRQRLYIHKHSFKVHTDNQTELSKRVIQLQKQERKFEIKYAILENRQSYSNTSKQCNFCTAEKFHILKSNYPNMLNKRSEIISKCHHRSRSKLK